MEGLKRRVSLDLPPELYQQVVDRLSADQPFTEAVKQALAQWCRTQDKRKAAPRS